MFQHNFILLNLIFGLNVLPISEGRNRKLEGLAAAILKLWNKSIIVKIALKMGVPNTNNEQMAYGLKVSFTENVHVGPI